MQQQSNSKFSHVASRNAARTSVAGYGLALSLPFAVLIACGGSDDAGPTPAPASTTNPPVVSAPAPNPCIPPPEGLPPPARPAVMGGTIAGRNDPSFIFVAPGDGEQSLLFYGPDLASTSNVTGFVYSRRGGGCSSSDLTTYNGRDWGRQVQDGRVYLHTATSLGPPTLSGTIRYASGTYAFAGGPVAGSTYDAAAAAKVADVVGKWTMTNNLGTLVDIAVDVNGAVMGSDRGCSFSGALTPSQGLNLLSLQLAFSSTCPSMRETLPGTHEGFALALPLIGGGTQLLIWAETNNGVDFSYVIAIGRR